MRRNVLKREHRPIPARYPGLSPFRRRLARFARLKKIPTEPNPQISQTPSDDSAGKRRRDDAKLSRKGEDKAMQAVPVLKRAAGLTSDIVLLTLASPIFAVWWLTRLIKKKTQLRD